jgi:phosphoglycolate phosphatase
MTTDSIIFDLDGTLWSALRSCVLAWDKALKRTGIQNFTVTEGLATMFMGKLLENILVEYFSFLPPEKHKELGSAFEEEERLHMKTYGGQLYPGAKDAIISLQKNYKLFIVSNCLEGYIENFLGSHELGQFFTDYECFGNTGRPKDDNIALIIKRNALNNPVYIGDTMSDYEASMKNNVPFIYATYGFGKVDNAEFRIDSLAEVGQILTALT